ncbi:MAG: AAA family ATPase [Armatimonadota bacterium]
MYIKRVTLNNIRCFDHLELDFASAGSSALFLGDNGDGKSTVLRCLAMGLCDESSAAALFRELSGTFVRHAPSKSSPSVGLKGSIEIDLDSGDGSTYRIITDIISLPNFERVTQSLFHIVGDELESVLPQKFPWDRIFVVGYGPGLRTGGTQDYQKYIAVDAVYPIFSYEIHLQNPELILRRLIDTIRDRAKAPEAKNVNEQKVLKNIQVLMKHLLDLKSPDDFQLKPTGVAVKGFWGTAGLSQLGDGFQATITWVLDLISWWFLRENVNSINAWDIESIEGIVIIDEIEQHLHPKWQHRIFPLLKKKFPKVQFIVATHSPLVASGSEDIEVHLFKEGQQAEVIKPYGWLAEDVYERMGLEDSRSSQFDKDILARYEELDLKKIEGKVELKPSEIDELKKLNIVLASMPEGDPVRLTLKIENIVKFLKDKDEEKDQI